MTLKRLFALAARMAASRNEPHPTIEVTRLNMRSRLQTRSNYQPHQGERERARRVRRGEAANLAF
jgi:hypothetical protein